MITFAFCYVIAFYGLTIGMFMGAKLVEGANKEESPKIKSPEFRVSGVVAEEHLPSAIEDWDQRWKENQK